MLRSMSIASALAAVGIALFGAGCTAEATPTDDEDVDSDDAALTDTPLLPGEPAYCLPSTFRAKEIPAPSFSGLNRVHAFRLGNVTLVGLAVGESKVASVQSLATSFAPQMSRAEKSCTFYHNDGNDEAQVAFNWYPLPKPTGSDYAKRVGEFSRVLVDIFDTAPNDFVACAKNERYIAMGCDGMKHRGPTVFAATLAYSGCSPEHATLIVNSLWGSNGIKSEMRVAIAQWAKTIAAAHPAKASELRVAFGGPP